MAETTNNTPSFSELVARIEDDHREARRGARRRLVILGLLVLLVLGYSSWIYSAVAEMDADALAGFARGYILVNLPDAKDTLREALIANAPAVTDQMQGAMVRLPKLVRSQLNEALPPGSEALAKRVEEDLDLQLETAVNAVVRLVDEKGQDVPREERIARLVDEARAVYHGMILTIVDDAHRDYADQVRQLNRKLRRLRKGRWLSANEQIHKEIIEATLVLIERHELDNVITPQTISDMGLAP